MADTADDDRRPVGERPTDVSNRTGATWPLPSGMRTGSTVSPQTTTRLTPLRRRPTTGKLPVGSSVGVKGLTIGARMSIRDQAAFIGRTAELSLASELVGCRSPASVVFVHGPGGIGKSALLRQLARRARSSGRRVVTVEGRELPPLPDALEAAVAPAHEDEDALVLIDGYEHTAALGSHLRRVVLPGLPDRTVVVIAGRRPPDPGWFEGGWEWLVRELELGPLSPEESQALLEAHGVADRVHAAELVAWARGSPLALTLAARTSEGRAWRPGQGEEPRDIVRGLVRRLAREEHDGPHRDALLVACIARAATVPLLRDVLPEADAAEAMRWLTGLSFAEPSADGVTLHELVRRALRSDLRQREPERERELRRRIADSLHARAVAGRLLLTVDLAELVEAPELRALYSWEGARRHRIDSVRDGDAEQVARQLARSGRKQWWALTRRFFESCPEVVAVARDEDGTVCGLSIAVTPSSAPAVAHEDPMLGPWLHHARDIAPDGNAILCRDAADFTSDPSSGIEAMIHVSTVLRCGLANPRYLYLPIDATRVEVTAFSSRLRARHIAELDASPSHDHVVAQCHLLDCGPGGLLGLQRDVVYAELGLTSPRRTATAPMVTDRATVRDALRNLRVPHALARSPLATGAGIDERAASVRRRLDDAAARAFGDTENERLLRRVLTSGYLDCSLSHEQAARELHLSRSAYFRRLKLASDRVADYLAEAAVGPGWDQVGTDALRPST